MDQSPPFKQLEIIFDVPSEVRTRHANYVLTQNSEHECYISFFEVIPPILMGTPEQIKAEAEKLTHVRATCISRFAVAKELMPKIIKAIQDLGFKAPSDENAPKGESEK